MSESELRAQFEADLRADGFNDELYFQRSHLGLYEYERSQLRWEGYQLAMEGKVVLSLQCARAILDHLKHSGTFEIGLNNAIAQAEAQQCTTTIDKAKAQCVCGLTFPSWHQASVCGNAFSPMANVPFCGNKIHMGYRDCGHRQECHQLPEPGQATDPTPNMHGY